MLRKKGILKSSFQISIITLSVKFLGLIKQAILASYCGANKETDLFFLSSGIMAAFCIVLFSALSISLLSMHTEMLIQEGREQSNKLINKALRLFLPISILISILFFTFSPLLSLIIAPSYSTDERSELIYYLRIMSLLFMFWCYSQIVNVVLETDKIFLPGRLRNLFQNLLIIIAALLLYKDYGVKSLLFAFLLSGFFEAVILTICARKKLKFTFGKIPMDDKMKKLLGLSVPLALGNAIYEVNDIVDKQISTGLGHGNVSFLTYGSSVNEIVTSVIITSVSTVLFSHFATWVSEKKIDKITDSLKNSIELLSIVIMPIMVVCLLCGDSIVYLLYGRGNFGEYEVNKTYGVVIGYSIGFAFQAMRANFSKVFYAFQDTKTPMVNGIIAVGCNILLSYLLSRVIGISGVALATSISMIIVTVLLLSKINKYLPDFSIKSSIYEILKIIIAGIVAFVSLYVLKKHLCFSIVTNFVIEGFICLIVYVVTLYVIKSNQILSLKNRIFRN